MNKSDKPKFSASWWSHNRPKGLNSADGLESALKSYEGAKGKLAASGSGDDADAAANALDGIAKAAKAVITEASSRNLKDNADMVATAACLKKFAYDKEQRWIDAHVEEGMFSHPDVYKQYLKSALKRLKRMSAVPGDDTDEDDEDDEDDNEEGDVGKGMNFGFVLGKKAEQHRLALHKSKSAKALGSMLTKETGIRKFTYGIARPSENKGEMVLELEGPQVPGMGKKGARMLKKFKPLPFTTIVLMVDGKVIADLVDPEDTDTDDLELDTPARAQQLAQELARALAELIRRIQGVADPALKGDLARMATQANALLRSNSLADASERIDQIRTALDRAGVPANAGNGTAQAVDGSISAAVAKSGQIWKAAVAKVQGELEKLRAEIVATYQTTENVDQVETRYRATVSGVLKALDEGLADKLNEVAGAANMAERAALMGEARGIMEQYQRYVASTPLLADLDDNPFVPLSIRQIMSTTLSALGKVVH